MKVGLDIDGVLARFDSRVIEIAEELFPGRVPTGYVPTDWYFSDVFAKEDLTAVFEHIKTVWNFWERSPSYVENVRSLTQFLTTHSESDVYFVTSRALSAGLSVKKQTEDWLYYEIKKYGIGYSPTVVPVENHKYKPDVMRAVGIQYSIDDYGPTVEACNSVSGHQAFLLDRPWNRDRDYGPRLDNLQQFFDIITGKVN